MLKSSENELTEVESGSILQTTNVVNRFLSNPQNQPNL